MTYTQRTYVGDSKEYSEKIRTADEMVELLAQVIRLKDAGEDIELLTARDEAYNAVSYTIVRRMARRTVFNEFTINR